MFGGRKFWQLLYLGDKWIASRTTFVRVPGAWEETMILSLKWDFTYHSFYLFKRLITVYLLHFTYLKHSIECEWYINCYFVSNTVAFSLRVRDSQKNIFITILPKCFCSFLRKSRSSHYLRYIQKRYKYLKQTRIKPPNNRSSQQQPALF